ncbi:PadR family transcriptional regulator [Haloplanus sp. GCM10025708]|uniref:PadR family transcriptional regulator n=1 Tax=Haloferacaceae TaxID=1644056 RepID=UPI003622D21A
MKWLRSGLRRDICAVVYAADAPTGQRCKTSLEAHYDDHLEPRRFYGALDALEDAGFLDAATEGIHDHYELTDAGERALLAHYEWLTDCLND